MATGRRQTSLLRPSRRSTIDQNGVPEDLDPQTQDDASGVTTGPTVILGGGATPTEPQPQPPPEPPPGQ